MRTRVCILSVVLCFLGGPLSESHASPIELYGISAKSAGMAGGGAASADDFGCVYLNPAGLAHIKARTLTLSGAAGVLDLQLGSQAADENTIATIFGLVVPLPLGGALRDRITLGLGIWIPKKALTRARSPVIGKPQFALLGARSEVVGIQVAAGFAINENWSVGAGTIALATLQGNIHVATDAEGRFITLSEQELRSHYTPTLGVHYTPKQSRYKVGLTIRGASMAGFDISITNDLEDSLPLSLPKIGIVGVPQYDPASVVLAYAHQINDRLDVAVQLDYKHWSLYPLAAENPVDNEKPLPGPGFRNTVVPRLSAQWQQYQGSVHLTARTGYAFIYSPAPAMRGVHNYLDNHRHQIALGFGIEWPDSLSLDLWMQFHQLMARTHHKDPALFASPSDVPFTSIRTSGRVVVGGLAIGVQL